MVARRTTRGLMTVVDRHTPFRATLSIPEKVEKKLQVLQAAPLGAYSWRETWQEFKHLANSNPNLQGRRLIDAKALTKAEYVARVAYRAYKGRELPEGRGWGHLRSALSIIYRELS